MVPAASASLIPADTSQRHRAHLGLKKELQKRPKVVEQSLDSPAFACTYRQAKMSELEQIIKVLALSGTELSSSVVVAQLKLHIGM